MVGRPIVILVGAGASYVSGDYSSAESPPLTTRLFHTPLAAELLSRYALAQRAGSAIERDLRDQSAPAFEAALKQLQSDGYAHHKQMARAVPLFLQALMLRYSEALRSRSERYGVLVDELFKTGAPLFFVSLNYDTLLDNHLAAFSLLNTLQDYLDAPNNWSLIKPHGSVAWYVEQAEEFDPTVPPGSLDPIQAPIECAPTTEFSLGRVRGRSDDEHEGPTRRYPSLALPDGPKDRLVIPPEHLEHFRSALRAAPEIDLLVLGYSGLDTEVLALIKEGDCKIRRLTVVNASPETTLEVFYRVQQAGLEAIWPDTPDTSYTQWIDGDGARKWAAEYPGPFPSVMKPNDLMGLLHSRRQELEMQQYEDRLDGLSIGLDF